MADTTARVLELLELLQSADLRTVAELAGRLGVDGRTVRRDVARLVDIGVPVETVRGRYGGYRLAAGQRVLPLVFGREEAVAVFLGLAAAQASADPPSLAAQTALAKVKRALPISEAGRIDGLLDVMGMPTLRAWDVSPDPAIMLTLAEATSHRRVVELRYVDGTGTPSRRIVHPYGIGSREGRWYLVAFDPARHDERTFRVDRIHTVRPLTGAFDPSPDLDVASSLSERFAAADYRWRVVLRINAAQEHIRKHLPVSVARLERLEPPPDGTDDGVPAWYRAEIHAESLDWLPPVLAALGCEVLIDEPAELRDRVKQAADHLRRAAGTWG
ncbi:helix-turn-helix transcriptional regulator [Demequina salsinemoris]|uniref:helix-turn-helix transcriptional regulator n=1 Tax=Demequina salsinemoris TaxID=577470 RepID=UPI000AC5261D|nr:YafY family protein [Demequina salsinemoris]